MRACAYTCHQVSDWLLAQHEAADLSDLLTRKHISRLVGRPRTALICLPLGEACVRGSELGSGHRPSVDRTCLDYHCQTPQDQSNQSDQPHPPSLAHRSGCQPGVPQVAVVLPRPASWPGQRAVAASGNDTCAVCVSRARVGRVSGVWAVRAGSARAACRPWSKARVGAFRVWRTSVRAAR